MSNSEKWNLIENMLEVYGMVKNLEEYKNPFALVYQLIEEK